MCESPGRDEETRTKDNIAHVRENAPETRRRGQKTTEPVCERERGEETRTKDNRAQRVHKEAKGGVRVWDTYNSLLLVVFIYLFLLVWAPLHNCVFTE